MTHTHDFVAVGLGPFNLGLACLTEPLRQSGELDGVFLEARDRFDWHPGMMLDDATLQVPFLADLVTMADPTSPYSFLNYLKETGRLYSFYIRESFYPLRAEYNQYCQWAADRLSTLRFGAAVSSVEHDGSAYVVTTSSGEVFRGRRLVLGVGAEPVAPECLRGLGGPACHSAAYLQTKSALQETRSITVVGSGQSAAEVYADLLADCSPDTYELNWVTRSPRFFPMEYTKLTLEMTSPEYTSYFQGLTPETRAGLLREQRSLYKGISSDTINAIFDALYTKQVHGGVPTTLLTSTAVTGAAWDGSAYDVDLHHTEVDESFRLRTESLVLATGYAPKVPAFLDGVRDRITWGEDGRYAVSPTYAIAPDIYVQNGEEHTHGFVAPDLGMGAYRNSVLIAAMLGREVYAVEKRIAFQEFGVPDRFRVGTA
ncbi:lysine N(6)-hydroxylase/L-ornithine N(5)-oxygenase family protein [Nocardioides speluncae]|uniref:lysine N(6)-hydroxylase/L-ornithine N(5)-oxygenase family protein n=1 Tax=Nocardioides speluncae TaxID=2670337 RepID=UPI000D6979AF|nr:SidA/IucD/PvdA family monooxygenase [Nocardioides speluncae]